MTRPRVTLLLVTLALSAGCGKPAWTYLPAVAVVPEVAAQRCSMDGRTTADFTHSLEITTEYLRSHSGPGDRALALFVELQWAASFLDWRSGKVGAAQDHFTSLAATARERLLELCPAMTGALAAAPGRTETGTCEWDRLSDGVHASMAPCFAASDAGATEYLLLFYFVLSELARMQLDRDTRGSSCGALAKLDGVAEIVVDLEKAWPSDLRDSADLCPGTRGLGHIASLLTRYRRQDPSPEYEYETEARARTARRWLGEARWIDFVLVDYVGLPIDRALLARFEAFPGGGYATPIHVLLNEIATSWFEKRTRRKAFPLTPPSSSSTKVP